MVSTESLRSVVGRSTGNAVPGDHSKAAVLLRQLQSSAASDSSVYSPPQRSMCSLSGGAGIAPGSLDAVGRQHASSFSVRPAGSRSIAVSAACRQDSGDHGMGLDYAGADRPGVRDGLPGVVSQDSKVSCITLPRPASVNDTGAGDVLQQLRCSNAYL